MTFGDFKILVKGLKTAYPSENFLRDEYALKLWYSLLGDMPYEVLNIAIQKHILTSKFPPTVSELRGLAIGLVEGEERDWGQAWGEVVRLIKKYGYTRPQEAYAEMDNLTLQTVKRLGWENICTSENIAVERANFRQIYEIVKQGESEQVVLPSKVREALIQITGNEMKRLGKGADMREGE